MGVSKQPPEEDNALQCALTLNVVNNFLCSTILENKGKLTACEVKQWQEYLFWSGLSTKNRDVPDDEYIRCKIRFFYVKGFSLISGSQDKGPIQFI